MGLFKLFFWIIIIVALLAIFKPGFVQGSYEFVTDLFDGSSPQLNSSSLNNFSESVVSDLQRDEEISEEEEEVVVEEAVDEDVSNNPCDWVNEGLPNYEGTNYEGLNCFTSGEDYPCISSPPVDYDGSINVFLKVSNPEMGCCEADGLCHWRVD